MWCPRAAALVAFAVVSLGVAPAVLAQPQMSAEDFCPEAEGRHLDCFVTRLADNDPPPAEPDQRLFPLNGTTFTDCLLQWASERDSPSLSGRYHFRIIFAVDIAHAAEVLHEHGVSYPDPTSNIVLITMRGTGDDATSSGHLGQVTFTSAIDDHGPICVSINGSAQTVPSEIGRDTRPDRDHRRPRVVIDMMEGSALKFDVPVWLVGVELVGSAQARRTARQSAPATPPIQTASRAPTGMPSGSPSLCPPCNDRDAWATRTICGILPPPPAPEPRRCTGQYDLRAWYLSPLELGSSNPCAYHCCTDSEDYCTLPPTTSTPTTPIPTVSRAPTGMPSGAPASSTPSSAPSGAPTSMPTTPVPSTATPSFTSSSATGHTASPAVVPSIPSTTGTNGSSGADAPSGALIGGVLALLLLLCLGAVVLLRSCRDKAERKPSAPYVTPSFGLTGAPIANQVFDQSRFFQNEADLPGTSNNSNNSNNSDHRYSAVDYSAMDGGLPTNAMVGPPAREYTAVDYDAMDPHGGACDTTATPPAEEYTAVDYSAMDSGGGIDQQSSAPPRPSNVAPAAQLTQYGVWSDADVYKQPVADEPADYEQPIAVADDEYATSEIEPSMYLQPVPVAGGSAEYAAPEGDTNVWEPPVGDKSTPHAASEVEPSMYQLPVPVAAPADDDTAMYEDPYAPAELAAPPREYAETRRRPHPQDDSNADAPVTVQRKRVGFAAAAADQVTDADDGAMYEQPVIQTRRRPTPHDDGNADAPVTVQRKRVGFADAAADQVTDADDGAMYEQPIIQTRRRPTPQDDSNADAPVTVQRKRVGFADAAADQVTDADDGAMYEQPIIQTRRRSAPQDDDNADAPVTVQRKRVGFASEPGEASSSDDDSNLYGEPINFAEGLATHAIVNAETRRRPKKEDPDNDDEVYAIAVGDAPATVQRKRVGVPNAPAEAASSDDEPNLYGEPISFAEGSATHAIVHAETRRMPKEKDPDNDDGGFAIAVGDGVQVKRYGETRRRRATDSMESDHDHDHDHDYEYTRTGAEEPNPPMYAQPPGNSTSPYVMLDMDHIVYRSPRIHQQMRKDVRLDEAGSHNSVRSTGSDATLYNLDYEASVDIRPLTGDRASLSSTGSMSSMGSSQTVYTDYDSFRRSTLEAPSYAPVPGFDDDPSDT